MTCRVYVGEYQDRITGAAATAYVVIDENGRLVKAMAQKVKTNKGLCSCKGKAQAFSFLFQNNLTQNEKPGCLAVGSFIVGQSVA